MKRKLILVVFILGFLGGVGWKLKIVRKVLDRRDYSGVQVQDPEAGRNELVTFKVDFGDGEAVTWEDGLLLDLSVFEALELLAKRRDIEVETEDYDSGIFVKAVGGRENTSEKAWIYFVNGESGLVAADRQIIKAGDVVEWRYIKPIY